MEEAEKVFVIRQVVRDELARSTFEKPRLESALARLREQLVAIQVDSHQVLADVAAELSESERAALAGRMTSRLIVREADRFARLKIEDRSAGRTATGKRRCTARPQCRGCLRAGRCPQPRMTLPDPGTALALDALVARCVYQVCAHARS